MLNFQGQLFIFAVASFFLFLGNNRLGFQGGSLQECFAMAGWYRSANGWAQSDIFLTLIVVESLYEGRLKKFARRLSVIFVRVKTLRDEISHLFVEDAREGEWCLTSGDLFVDLGCTHTLVVR